MSNEIEYLELARYFCAGRSLVDVSVESREIRLLHSDSASASAARRQQMMSLRDWEGDPPVTSLITKAVMLRLTGRWVFRSST